MNPHSIHFRGKRMRDGKWITGCLKRETLPCTSYCIWRTDGFMYRVDERTIGQYTGLHDKNYTRIFEGDILAGDNYPYTDPDGNRNYFAVVVWLDSSAAFGLETRKNPKSSVRGISDGFCDIMEDFNMSAWEVVGNIHDNPEFLDGADKEDSDE